MMHYSFLPTSQAITSESYCAELEVVHQKLLKIRSISATRKPPVLLHDNTSPHVALKTLQKLAELGYEVLPHPAYSLDLSPRDYHLFRHLDLFLRDERFKNQEMVETDFKSFIDSNSKLFNKCIYDLNER